MLGQALLCPGRSAWRPWLEESISDGQGGEFAAPEADLAARCAEEGALPCAATPARPIR